MLNINSYQAYSTLFKTLSQLPPMSAPGLSGMPAAYFTAKYAGVMNRTLSTNLGTVMKGFRADTANLKTEAKGLTAMSDRKTVSTGSGAATGITTTSGKTNSTISISQLAARQVNQSTLLEGRKPSALSAGAHALTVTRGDQTYGFTLSSHPGESNSALLTRTADAINGLKAGVNARVASDTLGNRQLILEGEATGKKSSFIVSGTLSEALGLNPITQQATNARYTYNDAEYESDSNTVTLDNGKTTLTLNQVTEHAEPLNQIPDTAGLAHKVTALISAYNRLQDTLTDSNGAVGLQAVSLQLNQLTLRKDEALNTFGISRDIQGRLNVDSRVLQDAIAARPEEARRLFVESGSLSEQLQSRADQLLKVPAGSLIARQTAPLASPPYLPAGGSPGAHFNSTQTSGNMFDLFL